MFPIEHGLTFVTFSLGFLFVFLLPLKHKTILLLLFLFTGLAIGMHEHVMVQDMFGYDKEIFYNLVVKMKERVPNPWNNALCLFIKNDPIRCPGKYDERWKNQTYVGEK